MQGTHHGPWHVVRSCVSRIVVVLCQSGLSTQGILALAGYALELVLFVLYEATLNGERQKKEKKQKENKLKETKAKRRLGTIKLTITRDRRRAVRTQKANKECIPVSECPSTMADIFWHFLPGASYQKTISLYKMGSIPQRLKHAKAYGIYYRMGCIPLLELKSPQKPK